VFERVVVCCFWAGGEAGSAGAGKGGAGQWNRDKVLSEERGRERLSVVVHGLTRFRNSRVVDLLTGESSLLDAAVNVDEQAAGAGQRDGREEKAQNAKKKLGRFFLWTSVRKKKSCAPNVGVREPVAVAGPGFPVVCVLFACAEFHVVCVFVRSSMLSVCLSGVLTLVLQKLPIVSLFCSSLASPLHVLCIITLVQKFLPFVYLSCSSTLHPSFLVACIRIHRLCHFVIRDIVAFVIRCVRRAATKPQ